jgi:LPS-assembly protein
MINDINLESFNLISDSGLKNSINFITKNIITTGNEHNEHDSSAEIKLMGLIEAETSLPLISKGDKFTNFLSPKVSIKYNPSDMKDYSGENRKIFNNNLFETNRLGLVDTLESGKV